MTHQIVSSLLGVADISVNTKTPEGWTALVAAADKGHHGLVRTLLKHRGTDVNIRDNQGKAEGGRSCQVDQRFKN